MRTLKLLSAYRMSLLSFILVAMAAALGADASFAMAVVDPVEEAADPNPSEDIHDRPAGEKPVNDEQGRKTQLPGRAATATDLRDAGLLAEDYDEKTVEFRKFQFPEEVIIARACTPVKAKDYVHKHWVTGSTDLDAVFGGVGSGSTGIAISATASSCTTFTRDGETIPYYNGSTKELIIPASAFDNGDILTEFSTVVLEGIAGYKKDADQNQISDGELVLFVKNHKTADKDILFKVINYPSAASTVVTITPATVFHVMATAGAESQMKVASDAFIPTDAECFLQKKIETATVTERLDEAEKKLSWKTKNILASAKENFKRKCARSHWNSTPSHFQVMVPETGNREDVFTEKGILRQIPMLYTHGVDFTDDDLLAITTLMFTTNATNDHAYVFCGQKALTRLIKLVNSNNKYKDVGTVEVNDYGIKVRKYRDNFGELEFCWAQTLDDLGYSDFMAVLDLEHAERPYLVNNKQTMRDMSKTGEAREAKEYNLVRIDCVDLKGHNALLVCPSAAALNTANLGGIEANFATWTSSTLPASTDENWATEVTTKYYLSVDAGAFKAGDVIQYDSDLSMWTKFEGLIR